jgi:hypothetical protein
MSTTRSTTINGHRNGELLGPNAYNNAPTSFMLLNNAQAKNMSRQALQLSSK